MKTRQQVKCKAKGRVRDGKAKKEKWGGLTWELGDSCVREGGGRGEGRWVGQKERKGKSD